MGSRRGPVFLRKHRATLLVYAGIGLFIGFVVFTLVTFFLTTGGAQYWSLPGSPYVYARIESLTDCEMLQREFDTAMRGLEPDQPDDLIQKISLSYAEFAADRMRDIGCTN